MSAGVIYTLTSPSGKTYIGQTKNLELRLRSYRYDKKGRTLISKAIAPLRGRKRPQYVCDAIRRANTGKRMSPENRIKVSEGLRRYFKNKKQQGQTNGQIFL